MEQKIKIKQKITLHLVRSCEATTIYYGACSCWWTHNPRDLRRLPDIELPCDPRGGMLLQTDDAEGFLKQAENNPGFYGKHGIDAFMAAHNDNCFLITNPTGKRFGQIEKNWCLETWEEYNEVLDKIN